MIEDLPPLMVAFSNPNFPQPARIELVGADDFQEPYVWSRIMRVTLYNPTLGISVERVGELADIVQTIAANKNLKLASELYSRSVEYLDMTAGSPSIAACVLAAYQVLETCSRIVPITPDDMSEDKTEAIWKALRDKLSSKSQTRKKITAIQQAANDIKRLQQKHMGLQIEHAARAFGLDQEWINKVRALGKTRNSMLAHPRSLADLDANDDSVDAQVAISIALGMLNKAITYCQTHDVSQQ